MLLHPTLNTTHIPHSTSLLSHINPSSISSYFQQPNSFSPLLLRPYFHHLSLLYFTPLSPLPYFSYSTSDTFHHHSCTQSSTTRRSDHVLSYHILLHPGLSSSIIYSLISPPMFFLYSTQSCFHSNSTYSLSYSILLHPTLTSASILLHATLATMLLPVLHFIQFSPPTFFHHSTSPTSLLLLFYFTSVTPLPPFYSPFHFTYPPFSPFNCILILYQSSSPL